MAPTTLEIVGAVIIVQLAVIAYLLTKIRDAVDKTRLTWLQHVYERYENQQYENRQYENQ
jgi:hypothetical protein